MLRILSGTLGTLLERYSLCTVVLLGHQEPVIRKSDFEKNCALMARRIAILGGTPETELFEKSTIHQFFADLEDREYIQRSSEDEYQIRSSMVDLEECALSLLSQDMRQGFMRVTKGKLSDVQGRKPDSNLLTIN